MRGVAARGTRALCGLTSSFRRVEPNFSGIVGAETKEEVPGCFLKGSSSSSNSTYSLVMDHERCGSQRNASSVWTYVVVQESGAKLQRNRGGRNQGGGSRLLLEGLLELVQ